MSESQSLQQAWTLLKDYNLLNHLPENYYEDLPKRMVAAAKQGGLQHVNPRPHKHYIERLGQRYKEGQKLPRQFDIRGLKKYGFSVTDIFNFMANDLIQNHPEIVEAMKLKMPASDNRLDEREPSLSFDVMRTDDPMHDESEKRRGMSHTVTPHFNLDKNGKLQLKTVGDGILSDRTRQNIHIVPITSPRIPEDDTHNNSRVHPTLPNRGDFVPKDESPSGFEDLQQPSPQQPQSAPEPFDKYAHLPPAFREAARRADEENENNVQTGEPMNMAWRLLKGLV